MNDNWTRSFQDKLGDWEMDVPVATPVHFRRGWLLPAAVAAAAALILLLLLPDSGKKPAVQPAARLLAEATPVSIRAAAPALPPVRTFAVRHRHVEKPGTDDQETAKHSVPDLPEPESQQPQQPDQTPVPTPEPPEETGSFPVIDSRMYHRAEGFSLKIQAGNFLSGDPSRKAVDPMGIQHLRQAKASATIHWTNISNMESNANNPIERGYSGNDLKNSQLRYRLPIKAGLSLRWAPIWSAFGLESGLTYSYQHVWQTFDNSAKSRHYRYHYAGIPLKADWEVAQWRHFRVYGAAGAECQWLVAGTIDTSDYLVQISLPIESHPMLFSLGAAAGVEYAFALRTGLYLEPGVTWTARPQGDLPNYYREHPLAFDLHVGLRFKL